MSLESCLIRVKRIRPIGRWSPFWVRNESHWTWLCLANDQQNCVKTHQIMTRWFLCVFFYYSHIIAVVKYTNLYMYCIHTHISLLLHICISFQTNSTKLKWADAFRKVIPYECTVQHAYGSRTDQVNDSSLLTKGRHSLLRNQSNTESILKSTHNYSLIRQAATSKSTSL